MLNCWAQKCSKSSGSLDINMEDDWWKEETIVTTNKTTKKLVNITVAHCIRILIT